MAVLYCKDIKFHNNGIVFLKNINLKIYGLTNIYSKSCKKKEIFLKALFDKFVGSNDDMFIMGGKIYLDDKIIPRNQIHLYRSKYKLFNKIETVEEALYMIDSERSKNVLCEFEIKFGNKKLCELNIDETRIFKILVEMVEMPPIVVIEGIELVSVLRKKYIKLIRKYVKESGSICLINSKYDDKFDNTIIIENKRIFSLNIKKYREYITKEFLNNISRLKCEERNKHKTLCNECTSDDNNEDMLDEKNKNKDIFIGYNYEDRTHLFNFDIYKMQIHQAKILAYRKYNLMVDKYSEKINIYKNIGIFVIFMLCVRAYQESKRELVKENIPSILCFFFSVLLYFYNFKIFIAIVFFLKFIFQELSWNRIFILLRNFFRNSYTPFELRIVTSIVHLCIFFGCSTILLEDSIFLKYYTTFLISPGTYITSILIYLFLTQFIAFIMLGFVFNINTIFITTINALFFNTLISCATSKKLRETFISLFMILYLGLSFIIDSKVYSSYKKLFLRLLAPFLITDMYYSGKSIFDILLAVSPFYFIIYIISCYRIYFFTI